MGQYFENDPKLKEDKHYITYYINNTKLSFLSDSGVFSKDYVDFGSSLLIKNCLKLNLEGDGIDLGCGIGVIGISIMNFNSNVNFKFIDVNFRAIELTKTNLKNHNLTGEVLYNDGLKNVPNFSADFIITNPPIRAGKEVIYGFYSDAKNVLKKGGKLLLVIQKKQGAPSTKNKLLEIFGNCTVLDKEKGYYIYQAINE